MACLSWSDDTRFKGPHRGEQGGVALQPTGGGIFELACDSQDEISGTLRGLLPPRT